MSSEPQTPTVEDRDPCYSPDGDSIAFVHWAWDWRDTLRPTGLYVVGATGGKPRLIIRGAIITPDWSPDGRWIAFTLAYGSPLFVVSPSGDSLRQITSFAGFYPSWSPDGQELLFATNYLEPSGARVLWIVPFDGSSPRDISQHGTGEWLDGDWSPDGTSIVHTRYLTGTFDTELFVMDRNGGNARRLTSNNVRDSDPTWSPRDSLIAWTHASEVRIMRTSGESNRKLTEGGQPSWAPDGQTIVVAREVRYGAFIGSWSRLLFTIRADGSGLRQITYE